MAAHGPSLLALTVVGLGGWWLLKNMNAGASTMPAPLTPATPGAPVPAPILQPSQPLVINNPFDDLVWNHPEAALYEEYAAWLHRIPDPAGQAYWLDRIAQAKAAGESPYALGAEINLAFQDSPEAVALSRAAGS